MNILTRNRILQKGDEYFDDDKGWMPVSKENFGLQVVFSGYSEVRRPSEKPFPAASTAAGNPKQAAQDRRKPDAVRKEHDRGIPQLAASQPDTDGADNGAERGGETILRETPETAKDSRTEVPKRVVSPTPISPDSRALPAAKAESEKSPVPTHSGTGDTLPKAEDYPMTGTATGSSAPFPKGEIEKAIEKAKLVGASNGLIKIKFPKSATGTPPAWTGRNGTFNGYGLEAMMVDTGENVMLSPIGKRGVGNCMIQFPVTIIPQLVDWLLRQQK